MNYGEQFVVDVSVSVRPLWIRPAESTAEQVGRSMTEARMEALGAELARFIRMALEAKQTPEEWADVSARLLAHFRGTP